MTKAKRKLTLPDASSLDMQSLLGPPPLLDGEDPAAYKALSEHIRASVAPRDVIEEIWVRDVVDNFWETLRLRRLKAKLMHVEAPRSVRALLSPPYPKEGVKEMVNGWALGDQDSEKRLKALLRGEGHDQDSIAAKTLYLNLDTFEKIDRMIMQTEARRNLVLREVDRHRDSLARSLRDAVTEIEDAQFEVVEEGGVAE